MKGLPCKSYLHLNKSIFNKSNLRPIVIKYQNDRTLQLSALMRTNFTFYMHSVVVEIQ